MGVLDEQKINNVLSSQVVGRLACTDGNIPYIVPVTYFFNGDYIYGQTQEGKKLEILRKNKKVCFEVDLMMDMRNWQSVIVFGDFEELTESEAKIAKELFLIISTICKRVAPYMDFNTNWMIKLKKVMIICDT